MVKKSSNIRLSSSSKNSKPTSSVFSFAISLFLPHAITSLMKIDKKGLLK